MDLSEAAFRHAPKSPHFPEIFQKRERPSDESMNTIYVALGSYHVGLKQAVMCLTPG